MSVGVFSGCGVLTVSVGLWSVDSVCGPVQFKTISICSENPIIMRSTPSLRSVPNIALKRFQCSSD